MINLPPPPPTIDSLRYGDTLYTPIGTSTVIATLDFETYSAAGYEWDANDPKGGKWRGLFGAKDKGLKATGTPAYSEHESTAVLCMAYDLRDGKGVRMWIPRTNPPPKDLFNHIEDGKLIEAWNAPFELWIWNNVCVPKYDFPLLPIIQLRCAMAKAKAYGLPGPLKESAKALGAEQQKDKRGDQLINLFCMPRKPTKKDPGMRALPKTYPEDAKALYEYCAQDIRAQAAISMDVPDLQGDELNYWRYDLAINRRGIAVDVASINNAIVVVNELMSKRSTALPILTEGAVQAPTQLDRIKKWLRTQGVQVTSLDDEHLDALLKQDLPPVAREVLEIRQLLGSAAVKKPYTMRAQLCQDERLHDLFSYYGARTGRASGVGPQPQNLPRAGPPIAICALCKAVCGGAKATACKFCKTTNSPMVIKKWRNEAADLVRDILRLPDAADELCRLFDDPLGALAGTLRSLFMASPGHLLVASDYSAIEAVVLAQLAGEEWRLEVFRTHGKIYEMSASKITGKPFEEYELYEATSGEHHPDRGTIGKVAELASGYGGYIGAWKQFGADQFFNEAQIKEAVLAWREASPNIVEFWGGQFKRRMPHYYGCEGMAISAVLAPGQEFECRGIKFVCKHDKLYIRLLSGRYMTYHQPRLAYAMAPRKGLALSYMAWNKNPKKGPMGWVRLPTYGGSLVENIVQAVARDILMNAIHKLESLGEKVVFHVHDELVIEKRADAVGPETVKMLERVMQDFPTWARDWPLKAAGGWFGKRYRK